jgi:DNA invertase Pin-like site-specific DNA recombinase
VARVLDEDELIGNWTLVGDELEQLSGRRGATKLGFALLLRFYAVHGRFPAGRGEIPDQAVAHVARLGAMLFAVLAVAAQLDRDYIRDKTLEGQQIAAAKGNHGGRPRVIDEDMLTFGSSKDKDETRRELIFI